MLRQPFPVAVALSVAGLIPFIAAGIVVLLDPLDSPGAILALICYGAVILSFIGAVHWGFALRDAGHPMRETVLTPDPAYAPATPGAAAMPGVATMNRAPTSAAWLSAERALLVWGVVPALVGFVALIVLLHFALPSLALFLLLAGFFLTVVMESIGKGRGVVAGNYLTLRWGVSIVVLVILAGVLFALLAGMRVG